MGSSNLDFYSTAAQVMPVLFVTLVFEAVRSDRKPVRTSLLLICITALVAESLSIEVLANQDPSSLKATIIAECLWIAGIFLVLRILLQAFAEVASDPGERDDTNLIAVSGLALLVAGLGAIPFIAG
jgi:membrane-associated HD superfamily phosphohydrolase